MNNKQIQEVLKGVRKLLENPKRWTQGTMARKEDGDLTYSTNPKACKWCLAGAIRRVVYDSPFDPVSFSPTFMSYSHTDCDVVEAKLLEQPDLKGLNNVMEFNDSHSHDEVLALIDKTIATL